MPRRSALTVEPVTPDRWDDFAALFSRGGWPKSCWCMFWRLGSRDFDDGAKARTLEPAMRAIVRRGDTPGLLAYRDDQVVGWVSIAPRGVFGRIERSKRFNQASGDGVWSLNCFVIDRDHRRSGVATALIRAAVAYAREAGAAAVEAYPSKRDVPTGDDYTGTVPMFERAGFRHLADATNARVVMRRTFRR